MQNFPIRKIVPGFSWFLRILQLQDCLLRNRDVVVHLRRPSDNMLQDIAPVCSVSCQNFFTYSKTDCFLIFSQGREKSMLPILFGNPNHVKSLIKHSRTIFRYVSEISPCRRWWSPSITSWIARKFVALVLFVSVVDLSHWERYFNELHS